MSQEFQTEGGGGHRYLVNWQDDLQRSLPTSMISWSAPDFKWDRSLSWHMQRK